MFSVKASRGKWRKMPERRLCPAASFEREDRALEVGAGSLFWASFICLICYLLFDSRRGRLLGNWFAEYKRSRVNLRDEFRDGRPSTAVNNKNIDVAYSKIKIDRHVTYHEIQASLRMPKFMSNIGINKYKQSYTNIWRFSSPEEAAEEYEKYVFEVTGEE
ncbi:hypothetical protein EVAR_23239_1 [Eumeta japonica]|uniref:Uncharacterized protein n=1 Tax=Eumeta variegata TaxID=151549 RepID=A0A4C1VDP5_EUMVA|nr:hypothetical protein EVAR_23239_1 [Eumeta japonica]